MSETLQIDSVALKRHHRHTVTPLVKHLGGLRAIYQCSEKLWTRLLGPVCLLISLLLLGVYVANYELLFSWWPLTQVHLFLMVCGLWLLLGLIFTLTHSFAPHGCCILVCVDDLISIRRTPIVLAWNDIEQVWQASHHTRKANKTHAYMLRTKTGELYLLPDDIPDLAWLVEVIERKMRTKPRQDTMKVMR